MTRTRIALGTLVIAVAVVVAFIVIATHSRRLDAMGGTTASHSGARMASMPGLTAASPNGTVTLTSAQLRQFGVTFGTAEVRTLSAESRATGVVTVDETRIVQVTPKFGGFVERLYVNATAQPVHRGQPLLEIYSPELIAAQQELLVAARLQRDIGRSTVPGVPAANTDLVEAARRRLQLWDIATTQIEEVLRTGTVRRSLTLYAPASGVVLDKRVVQGQAIAAGQELYTLADLSSLWVEVQLRETDAAAVRAGTGADIEVVGLPGRPLKGSVAMLYPTLDSASRAIRARVVVTNSGGVLRPGMYATVRLMTPSHSALTIPSSAILRTGERNVVFVDRGSGELMPHRVEIGRSGGGFTEILSGIDTGQRVVTSAQFLLDSESNLGEVMRSMIGQGSASDVHDMPGMQVPGDGAEEMNNKGADLRAISPGPRR
jgi:multidrug efflux pump subunit AcrA (membrane-fusion protein)